MEAKFTLAGFEDFLNNYDNSTLFKDVVFPDGADKDLMKGVLLERYGEMETLYSDPFRMQFATTIFFKKHAKTFEKWYTAINLDYEPLYNFDRYEEWEDQGEGSKNANRNSTINDTEDTTLDTHDSSVDGSDSSNNATNTRTTENTSATNNVENLQHLGSNASNDQMNIDESTIDVVGSIRTGSSNGERTTAGNSDLKVAAYNSTTLPENERTDNAGFESNVGTNVDNTQTDGSNSRTGNNATAHSGSDSYDDDRHIASSSADSGSVIDTNTGSDNRQDTHSGTSNQTGSKIGRTTEDANSAESTADHSKHTGHLYGNIGVTTSSALLKEYLDISQWSFYDHVADLYAEELLLMVY